MYLLKELKSSTGSVAPGNSRGVKLRLHFKAACLFELASRHFPEKSWGKSIANSRPNLSFTGPLFIRRQISEEEEEDQIKP